MLRKKDRRTPQNLLDKRRFFGMKYMKASHSEVLRAVCSKGAEAVGDIA